MSEARKGKYLGKDNIMSNPEVKEKQRLACIGRRKTVREDGTWYWKKSTPNEQLGV
jgi:hypothetical protein